MVVVVVGGCFVTVCFILSNTFQMYLCIKDMHNYQGSFFFILAFIPHSAAGRA